MKAVVVYEAGGPDKLIYTEVPTPEIKKGWSLVRVKAFGVNHSEIFTRQGLSPSVVFPRILGIECVGAIEKTTDEKNLPVGQTVVSIMGEMGRAFDGSYAEYALLPNDQIYPVTTTLPLEIFAALPETYYTAYGSLKNLRVTQNDRVLVRGATSGVGVAFLRLLKGRFPTVHVAGSTRSAKKIPLLQNAGFDEILLEENGKLQDCAPFDKVLELIGPAVIKDTFSHTCEGAIICSTGQLGGVWAIEQLEPIQELPKNGYLTSFYSGNVDRTRLQEMFDYVETYGVDARPEKVFSLEQTAEAHAYLESGDSLGKVVIVNDRSSLP